MTDVLIGCFEEIYRIEEKRELEYSSNNLILYVHYNKSRILMYAVSPPPPPLSLLFFYFFCVSLSPLYTPPPLSFSLTTSLQ